MKWKRFATIPVCSVLMLMGLIYYITVFIFIDDWVGLPSSAGTLNVLIFTSMASLCLFSFAASVLTDPGYVPPSYAPDIEGASSLMDPESQKDSSRQRQCDKCSKYKPPRAHHCRVCRVCVLRMDHHCLWINNCVGYWNYKAFFNLVSYATAACIYSMVVILNCSTHKDWDIEGQLHFKIVYILSGILMGGMSITLGTLLGWHIYLIARNMTTIEYHEGTRAAWLAKKSGQMYRHPFNISVYGNISSVLGPNMLKWFCPTAVGHLKDGTSFPTSHQS
ncbi:Probable protein S-acyltransferase 15 [Linum grandiflorum]